MNNPHTYTIDGCFVDPDHKFCYIHVYKNASISLRDALNMRGRYFKYADVKDQGLITLFIIRHPIRRIISIYLYMLRLEYYGFDDQHPLDLIANSDYYQARDDPIRSFDLFIDSLLDEDSNPNFYSAVTMSQSKFLDHRGLKINDIDVILVQENILKDFDALKKQCCVKGEFEFPHNNQGDREIKKLLANHISETSELQRKIQQIYADDFSMYESVEKEGLSISMLDLYQSNMFGTNLSALYQFLDGYQDNKLLSKTEKNTIAKYAPMIGQIRSLPKNDQLTIFSSAKKFFNVPILKTLDCHLFRVELAQLIVNYRRRQLMIEPTDPYLMEYMENGIIMIPNFLSSSDFNRLRQECYQTHKKNPTLGKLAGQTRSTIKAKMGEMKLTEIPKFVDHPVLNHILYMLTGLSNKEFYSTRLSNITFNKITYSPKHDVQTEMHTDTFQPTFRWWLYLDDVELKHGPFHYVKGSHINTPERLEWEQQKYQKVVKTRDPAKLGLGDREGSFRNNQPENQGNQFAAVAPKNTLVIADTHGLHRRGNIEPKCTRFCLFGYTRTNPFYFYS